MELQNIINEKKEKISMISNMIKEEHEKYNEILIALESQKEEIKEEIVNTSVLLYELSKISVDLIGGYIAKLMTNFEGETYAFHKPTVDYILGHVTYGGFEVEEFTKVICVISKIEDVKEKYSVKIIPEFTKNPFEKDYIIFGDNKEFNFYNKSSEPVEFLNQHAYLKDFIDMIIDYKYKNQVIDLDDSVINSIYNKVLCNKILRKRKEN